MSINSESAIRDPLPSVFHYLKFEDLHRSVSTVCKNWNQQAKTHLKQEANKRYSANFVNGIGFEVLHKIPHIPTLSFNGNQYTSKILKQKLLSSLQKTNYFIARFTLVVNGKKKYGLVCLLQSNKPGCCGSTKDRDHLQFIHNFDKISSEQKALVGDYFKRLYKGSPCGLKDLSGTQEETARLITTISCCCFSKKTSYVSLGKTVEVANYVLNE